MSLLKEEGRLDPWGGMQPPSCCCPPRAEIPRAQTHKGSSSVQALGEKYPQGGGRPKSMGFEVGHEWGMPRQCCPVAA